MHELPFAKSIFKSVVNVAMENQATVIRRVDLEVGVLRDFVPEIVNKYWAYVTKGSIAEGSAIVLHSIAAEAQCQDCGKRYPFNNLCISDIRCPACGCDRGTLIAGRELRILEIEII